MPLSDFLRSRWPALLLGLVLCGLYANQFILRSYIEIEIQTYINYKAPVQIYWASEDQPFSENRVSTHWIFHKHNYIRTRVGDLSGNVRLRIDPIRYRGHAKIKSVYIDRSGYRPQLFNSAETLSALKPVNDIVSAEFVDDGLVVETGGRDSQLVMDMQLEKLPGFPWHHLINFALILALSIWLFPKLTSSFDQLQYVPVCLTIVMGLVILMATLSTPTVHPDEKTHFKSIRFYQHHNLPPTVDAPEMQYTYSEYGNSRLIGSEIYYPLVGFYTRMLEDLKLSMSAVSRSFSVLMFLVVLLCAIGSVSFRAIVTPLLVTSQVWYHYGYANSDMFAITVCLLVSWMVVEKDSWLNQLIENPLRRNQIPKLVLVALALGSLLFLKLNYYTYALFVGIFYLWKLWAGDYPETRPAIGRALLIAGVALLPFAGKMLYDGVINEWDRADRRHAMWEKHPEMYLRERGRTLSDMLTEFKWGGKTFLTSFGGYGFTQYFATSGYYNWLKGLLLIMLLVLAGSVMIRAPARIKVLLVLTVGCCLLVIGISLVTSWIRILQPQGRYLAPILPICGMMFFHVRQYLPKNLWNLLVLATFTMAVYSFLFTGLADIPKLSG